MPDSMADRFISGELLAEDLEFLSDREQELLSGGNSVNLNGFYSIPGIQRAAQALNQAGLHFPIVFPPTPPVPPFDEA
jgi:hypothetical protein